MDDDNRISITVCGDGGCGKSSITLRLVRSQWTSEYDPTIGMYKFMNTFNPPSVSAPWAWHHAKYASDDGWTPPALSHFAVRHPTVPPPASPRRAALFTTWPGSSRILIGNQPGPPSADCDNPPWAETDPDSTTELGGADYISYGPITNKHTEDSYSVTRTIDGRTYHLNLTDTAGQEEYRGLWAASNLRSDAFLLVYDITNGSTLDSLSHFHDLIAMEEEQRADAGAVAPVKIVAGNKCDLQSMRQVRASEGLAWAKGRRCGFMETSAREMVNIEETFALIVRRVVEARMRHANGGELPAPQGVGPGERVGVTQGNANANVAFGQRVNSEKPVTTIDPRKMLKRRRQNKGGFWGRFKCW